RLFVPPPAHRACLISAISRHSGCGLVFCALELSLMTPRPQPEYSAIGLSNASRRQTLRDQNVTRLRGTSGFGEKTFTARRRKRGTRTLALSVAKVFLGVTVFLAPTPRVLAQDPSSDIGMLMHSKDTVYPLKASENNRYLV